MIDSTGCSGHAKEGLSDHGRISGHRTDSRSAPAAGTVPAVEQPARPAPANRLAVAGVVLAVLVVLGARSGSACGPCTSTSILDTSLAAIEAASNDDIAALQHLIPAETVATPEFRRRSSGRRPPPAVHLHGRRLQRRRVGELHGGRRPEGQPLAPPGDRRVRRGGARLDAARRSGRGPGASCSRSRPTGGASLYIQVGKKGVSFLPEDAKTTFGNVGG